MGYLFQIGDMGAIETIFSKYLQSIQCLIVGIGTGEDSLKLKNIANCIVGIDIAKPQLRIAKKLGLNRCELILCDAEQLPFIYNAFTSTICRTTFHHFPNIHVALAQMVYVLKKEGILVLHEPGLPNSIALISRRLFHTIIHTPRERPFIPINLKRIVSSKFDVKEVTYSYIISPILPVILKYLKRIPVKWKKITVSVLYKLDKMLLKTPLKKMSTSFILVCNK